MNAREEPFQPGMSQDVSHQALGLARLVDRFCRQPGRYVIILDVPDPRRQVWQIELLLVDALQRTTLRRN